MYEGKNFWDRLFIWILFQHRWAFVIFILPLSLIYDCFLYIRVWVTFKMQSAPGKHREKVAEVQRQVKEWVANGKKTKMCTGRPSWSNMSIRFANYKKTLTNIYVNLVDILNVDEEKRTVKCQPLVTMGHLTACLNPIGYTIEVIPELDDLTVGGLINGIGVETSSHHYGLFKDTIVSMEIVLPDGSVVTASETQNSDLFHAIPFSHGTLGFLVSAEIKIIPCKPWIKLEYAPTYTLDESVEKFRVEIEKKKDNFLVEGLMFSEHTGVIMTGNMVDEPEDWSKVNRIGRFWKPWFFIHAASFLKSGPGIEYIPMRDYYHRHTRSFFWEMEDIIPFGNAVWFRHLFGWMVPPKVSFLKLCQTETISRVYEDTQLVQDMLVPLTALKDTLAYVNKHLKIVPIWLCPYVCRNTPGLVHPATGKDEFYVDVGVYGTVKTPNYHPIDSTRHFEDFVRSRKGHQMLYADSYTTREEFAQMYDRSLYDKMRKSIPDCELAFPDVYDKTIRSARS